ncbi:hypothetical protein A6R68_04416, partial [Neotoma lepida]
RRAEPREEEAWLALPGAGRLAAVGGLVQPPGQGKEQAEQPEASRRPRKPTRRGVDPGCGTPLMMIYKEKIL